MSANKTANKSTKSAATIQAATPGSGDGIIFLAVIFSAASAKVGVRFLVDLAIRHFHFSSGLAHAPFTEKIVGGRARLGVVTYKGGSFKILE